MDDVFAVASSSSCCCCCCLSFCCCCLISNVSTLTSCDDRVSKPIPENQFSILSILLYDFLLLVIDTRHYCRLGRRTTRHGDSRKPIHPSNQVLIGQNSFPFFHIQESFKLGILLHPLLFLKRQLYSTKSLRKMSSLSFSCDSEIM